MGTNLITLRRLSRPRIQNIAFLISRQTTLGKILTSCKLFAIRLRRVIRAEAAETRGRLEPAAQDSASQEPTHLAVSKILVFRVPVARDPAIRVLAIMEVEINVLDKALSSKATSQVFRATPNS